MWTSKTFSLTLCALLGVCPAFAQTSAQSKDQIAPTLSNARRGFTTVIPRPIAADRRAAHSTPAPATPIDSIRTFAGEFQVSGFDAQGNPQHRWLFTMAGGSPEAGGTTNFNAPIVPVSLDLLDALHLRWAALLRSMDADDFNRGLRHPEHGRIITLKQMLGLYAWHGRHHVAHITSLKKREGW